MRSLISNKTKIRSEYWIRILCVIKYLYIEVVSEPGNTKCLAAGLINWMYVSNQVKLAWLYHASRLSWFIDYINNYLSSRSFMIFCDGYSIVKPYFKTTLILRLPLYKDSNFYFFFCLYELILRTISILWPLMLSHEGGLYIEVFVYNEPMLL